MCCRSNDKPRVVLNTHTNEIALGKNSSHRELILQSSTSLITAGQMHCGKRQRSVLPGADVNEPPLCCDLQERGSEANYEQFVQSAARAQLRGTAQATTHLLNAANNDVADFRNVSVLCRFDRHPAGDPLHTAQSGADESGRATLRVCTMTAAKAVKATAQEAPERRGACVQLVSDCADRRRSPQKALAVGNRLTWRDNHSGKNCNQSEA